MSTSLPFEAFIAHLGGRVVVVIRGDVDMAVTSALWAVVDDAVARSPHLALDMADVTFLGSSGLRVLVAATVSVGEQGSVTLRNTPAQIARVIRLAGLSETLKMESAGSHEGGLPGEVETGRT